jgi:hypothetical protein
MHHQLAVTIARDRIADLHRTAAEQRLAHAATDRRPRAIRAVINRCRLALPRTATDTVAIEPSGNTSDVALASFGHVGGFLPVARKAQPDAPGSRSLAGGLATRVIQDLEESLMS